MSTEIRELFEYITRYKPHNIELETKMRPFIPDDYIPATGDMDPFTKVPRPDGKADHLGLVTLDEPVANQSDPSLLNLQLRASSHAAEAKAAQAASKAAAHAVDEASAAENATAVAEAASARDHFKAAVEVAEAARRQALYEADKEQKWLQV